MPNAHRFLIVWVAAALVFVAGFASVHAADQLIPATDPASLAFPATQLPASFSPQAGQAGPLQAATMKPLLGTYLLGYFQTHDLSSAYHGWFNVNSASGAPFVVYELYGFSSIDGARLSRIAFQNLIQGLPVVVDQLPGDGPLLPKSSAIWTDTSTFGPANSQPFAIAEIVFRVANVVGHVIGYNAGTGLPAITAAEHQAAIFTESSARWLSGRLPASRQSLAPLLPLAILPRMFARARRR